jgi:hypothetical protein
MRPCLVCTPARPRALSAVRTAALTAILLPAAVVSGCTGSRDSVPAVDSGAALPSAAVPVMPQQLDSLIPRDGVRVERAEVRRDSSTFSVGPAVVMLAGGDSVVVSDSAYRVWALGRDGLVAYSALDGAGGFENEGQSLTVVDLATGARRRVVADYFPIIRVELLEVAGRRALLVHMRDGGQGSVHVTVVDPVRGQVFRTTNALGRIESGRILVAGYGNSDTAVDFGDKRTPLRVDTIAAGNVGTMSLLVVPRSTMP